MNEIPSYYTNINQELLSSIPIGTMSVLEIGCGSGALAQKYILNNPEVIEYWGVEYSHYVSEVAKLSLTKVLHGSIEDEKIMASIPDGYFDVLVIGDVLEHLNDPWSVLRKLSKKMKKYGVCVACIPNVQHWSIIANLAAGHWEYEESGLMDRTHLRFFNRSSMIDLFNQNGWEVESQRPRIFSPHEGRRFFNEIQKFRDSAGIKNTVQEDDFLALQWIIKANVEKADNLHNKSNANSKLIAISSCVFAQKFLDVRTTLPSSDLSKINGVDVFQYKNEIDLTTIRSFAGPKIIIVQRPRIDDQVAWLKAVSEIYKADCVVIYEIDDHPDLISKVNEGGSRDFIFRSVCAVQTSTITLKNYFNKFNSNVEAFNNCCHDLPVFTRRHSNNARIFYGALNRGEYSPKYASMISEVIKKHNAEIYVVSDRNFFESLSEVNKKYFSSLSYREYLSTMRSCDILLSPLDGRPGEKFKSDIKYVEASAQGLVTLASRLVYGDTIEDGVTGIVADSGRSWPEALDWLLSNPTERQRIAWNAWNYVRRERLFTEQAPLRIRWYLDLWERRHELWEEVFDRVPELRSYI